MHLRVRVLDLKDPKNNNDLVLSVSRTSKIKDLQGIIYNKLRIDNNRQKLYYGGKELSPDHLIADYNIKLNEVIQLYVRGENEVTKQLLEPKNVPNLNIDENVISTSIENKTTKLSATSQYFEKEDRIDVLDQDYGAWFEAKILDIFKKDPKESDEEENLFFKIRMDRGVETAPLEVEITQIRPRAFHTYSKSEIIPGMVVMVNYNIDEPDKRGYWYDFKVDKITKRSMTGTLLVGTKDTIIENCTIKFTEEVMRIETNVLKSQRNSTDFRDIPLRQLPLYCTKCKDNPRKKCKDCGCQICLKKDNDGILLLCDECNYAYHLGCLTPPLLEVPPADTDWYCPGCKTDETEIVNPGENLKSTKRKLKVSNGKEGRDWGSGMACVGRSKECTLVPKHHFGPVPGVEVGTCWKYRVQVSEEGIHRPPVAGIHGRESDGAYSIVLSGGYEDDHDDGIEFYYTGSGGRDLSGNKRTNGQSSNQTLTRMNKALALNCNAKFDDKTGATAKDWKAGKPVRVVRNFKLGKYSKYAPVNGNRYDGIYKVVKYFPEKGKSGFIVWRYFLRRDDPTPAPWEEGGQEYDMIDLPGYSEVESNSERKASKKKRKLDFADEPVKPSKINKIQEKYQIKPEIKKLLDGDTVNTKLWKECEELACVDKQQFLNKVKEVFTCVCCLEIVLNPVTTTCLHNVCKKCLQRSFASNIHKCPWCRFDLGADFDSEVNANLGAALKLLFPGYECGR